VGTRLAYGGDLAVPQDRLALARRPRRPGGGEGALALAGEEVDLVEEPLLGFQRHARGVVPCAIATTQGVKFGTLRTALTEAGFKIPSYLSWDDAAFGKVECCTKCGRETAAGSL
jgi:hypothetical protein